MNSCLYKAKVMHHRLEPKRHRFHYQIFMFYLDLDEIDSLSNQLLLLSRNKFNFFNFRDKDHLQLPREKPDTTKNTKQHLLDYLKQNNVVVNNPRIMLLTNLCTLGYQFNPVSFYFCFDDQNNPICAVAEVGNTFLEMKPYFLGKELMENNHFHLRTPKYFYVSPFIAHDVHFDFNLTIPDKKLNIRIDDYEGEKRIFLSTLTGNRKNLNNLNLIWYSIRFPFITLKVISLIHWQALILWFKKIRYYKKSVDMDLQKDVYRPYKK